METEEFNAASKRVPKMTIKAQEEWLNQVDGNQKSQAGTFNKANEIEALLEASGNVDTVYECINGEFAQSFLEFEDINNYVR